MGHSQGYTLESVKEEIPLCSSESLTILLPRRRVVCGDRWRQSECIQTSIFHASYVETDRTGVGAPTKAQYIDDGIIAWSASARQRAATWLKRTSPADRYLDEHNMYWTAVSYWTE